MTTEKITIQKIVVDRAEGLIEECFQTEHKTVDDANLRLIEISKTAPKNGGYDKTDVIIFFSDGDEWKARHDIQFGMIDETIENHWKRHFNYILKIMPNTPEYWQIKNNPNAKIEARAALNKMEATGLINSVGR